MHLKLSQSIRKLFKNLITANKFWQDNYLILREFKHFRKTTILSIIFSLLAATFEGVSIGFLLSFLQSLTNPNAQPQIGISWVDGWIANTTINPLYLISILILLSTWMRVTFNYFASIYTETAQLNLAHRLRVQMFEQLQALSISYFAKTRSGELINTITTEIERIKACFGGIAFLFTRGLTVTVYFIAMFLISWQLSIISVLVFSLLAVGLTTFNARIREQSFGISNANGALNSTSIEFINGIRTVHAFGTQNFERQRFYKASENVFNASVKVALAWTLVKPVAEAIATTVLVSLIIISFTQLTLPVASLLTFFFVLLRAVPSIQDMNGTFAFLSTLKGSVENIKELLRTDNKTYFKNGDIAFSSLQRAIDLISVDFGYDPNDLVLHNITLTIERGKMTALVGASGAGKTTLVDLIPRFYDPTQGQVLIDGVDVRQFEVNSLRRKMAVVSQDTFIFNTSVWNNIAYGTPEATEAEIREAARLANALEFIEEMPVGFDTQLGDRGVRLSGGQRQRIAIARALLRDPEILILDEATSALDSVSERLIQESIEKLSVGRTVIAIAHRLSTIAKADKVVVLEQGRIVEQGNYQELLQQRGKLWNYHQMQHEIGQLG
ncbi:MAG: ABC transporter ATP-binding protein [Chlorogloeopsis fritschii C42_A2020_084]|uniref:heterocyst formation ABC transporter subunit HepA n=1 Tax=Chlorogloeopsis fritschii TaxID=1124 RepID=UPI0019DA0ACA|nr:heterocyst formation ABC transporter subunit HepA [Chlorogloeopsis fritschii]MBF2004718.1 ABC transporter ATP-binding protein [Chlorogloeopsis fritschii C42_A2020_084]